MLDSNSDPGMKRNTPPRILMLLQNQVYPHDYRVWREAQALVRAGYDLSVISPNRPGKPWRERLDGVEVYRYPMPWRGNGLLGYLWEYGYSLAATWVLACFVFVSRGFDVLHAHNPPDTFVLIAIFFKLVRKKFVYDHHDLAPEMYEVRFLKGTHSLVYRCLLFFENLSCRWADHIIVTNESYKNIAIERAGVAENRVTIVRNGPDLELSSGLGDAALRTKASYLLGYAGCMGVQDGVDYLLPA